MRLLIFLLLVFSSSLYAQNFAKKYCINDSDIAKHIAFELYKHQFDINTTVKIDEYKFDVKEESKSTWVIFSRLCPKGKYCKVRKHKIRLRHSDCAAAFFGLEMN